MRGTGIGTLNIYALAQNQLPQMPLPTWTRSADQGALWKQAEVTINLISNFQVSVQLINNVRHTELSKCERTSKSKSQKRNGF